MIAIPHFELAHLAICFFLGALSACAIYSCIAHAMYWDGVTAGYGYSRDPDAFTYKEVGEYLRDHCSDRWPELRTEAKRGRVYRHYMEHWGDNWIFLCPFSL
jgi:hypothetical protein